MGEVIKFPTIEKQSPPVTPNETTNGSAELSVLSFKNIRHFNPKEKEIKACFLEGSMSITDGSEVVIELFDRKYKGVITSILQKDKNNNITKITYTIPFLESDDPFKFGEASFTYKVETHD